MSALCRIDVCLHLKANRPKDDDITVSLLNRAKANGYTALVITLDTMLLGWRPHDLDTSYLPFLHGVGIAVGTSDPVFMSKFQMEPHHNHVEFPYDPSALDRKFVQGDEDTKKRVLLGREWLGQSASGNFKAWKDLALIREHWKGPIVLKGIQSVAVRLWYLPCLSTFLNVSMTGCRDGY